MLGALSQHERETRRKINYLLRTQTSTLKSFPLVRPCSAGVDLLAGVHPEFCGPQSCSVSPRVPPKGLSVCFGITPGGARGSYSLSLYLGITSSWLGGL